MRRSELFLLQEMAGSVIVVPVGKATVHFPGMITLNQTGAYLWKMLETPQTEETLTQALLDRYEVTADQALADVQAFVAKLKPAGAIVEDEIPQ